jgi:hypothetical protein
MNNPDEKTAIEQFGSGDKYFGVCTVLATLPGLPMFGHGQVEGYSEKYGMEFRWAKWDETPNEGLIGGHDWRIFPLLHRRFIFADVEQFLLYDFFSTDGGVNEEVFAYSNRHGDPSTGSGQAQRGLIVYHNKFADARGWIKTSAAYTEKSSGKLMQKNLAEGLGLPRGGHVIFKDYVTHLEYIRSCAEIWDKGMYFELNAYQCHAFMDWRFVGDVEWETVCSQLSGAGVPSMQEEWRKLFNIADESVVLENVPAKKRAPRKTAVKAKEAGTKRQEGLKVKPPAKVKISKKTPSKTAAKPVKKKQVVKSPKTAVKKKAVKKPAAKKPLTGKTAGRKK